MDYRIENLVEANYMQIAILHFVNRVFGAQLSSKRCKIQQPSIFALSAQIVIFH